MLRLFLLTCLMVPGLVSLTGCRTPKPSTAMISGRVTSWQPMTLPPGAVLEVRMVDMSASPSGPTTVEAKRIEPVTRLPLDYVLVYQLAWIRPGHQYAVQAQVLVEGEPWMVTDTVNHFMREGRIAQADVIVKRVE